MKKKLLALLMINLSTNGLLMAQLEPQLELSVSDSKGGGGGDDCENRIQSIGLDIKNWIKQGGSQSLVFENGLEVNTYNKKMLEILDLVNSKDQLGSVLECTSEPIFVGNTEKTCRWERSETDDKLDFKILCNYERFMSGISDENKKLDKEDAQYQLVHHEIAGVAGVEGSYKDRSNYNLSNQIVASLENVVVKMLAVKKKVKEVVPAKGCNIYWGDFNLFKTSHYKVIRGGWLDSSIIREKKSTIAKNLESKGYNLVSNIKKADFSVALIFSLGSNINHDIDFDERHFEITHIQSGHQERISGKSRKGSLKRHPYNDDISWKILGTSNVKERISLKALYREDLDEKIPARSADLAAIESMRTCSKVLGQ